MSPRLIIRHLALAAVAIFVVACDPVYRTAYTFTPPTTEQGKICMLQCEQIKQSCYTNCKLDSQMCLQEARREASILFREYVIAMKEAGAEIIKTREDFYDPQFCGYQVCSNRCDASHRACYPVCGGQVQAYTYCAANCD
jgi:hypothetical protein